MERGIRVRIKRRESRGVVGVARIEPVPGEVEGSPVEGGSCDVVLVGPQILWDQWHRHVSESVAVRGNLRRAS